MEFRPPDSSRSRCERGAQAVNSSMEYCVDAASPGMEVAVGMHTRRTRSSSWLILTWVLAFATRASAQSEETWDPPAVTEHVGAGVVLEGFVLDPGGTPAQSAVVVSSAGGRAVADAAGHYRLEVEVPFEAQS